MIYRLFHPREGTLLHMLDLYVLLIECILVIGVFICLVNQTIHPFTPGEIAYIMMFSTGIYSFVAIVNSLEVMGFAETDEDVLEEDETLLIDLQPFREIVSSLLRYAMLFKHKNL